MENNNLIEVICPVYKGKDVILPLTNSLLNQKDINLSYITYVITESDDKEEDLIKDFNKIRYFKIKQEEFNHALTREKYIKESEAKVVVMITEDIIIHDEYALSKLVKSILDKECSFAFGRQICNNKSIERYIREINYPKESRLVSKEDISKMGLNAFFCSDAFAAYEVDVFKEIGGYDSKPQITSEDMYYARKTLLSNHKMKYIGDAEVEHSHKYTLKQLKDRYGTYGSFFRDNPEFNEYGSNKAGLKLAFKVFGKILKHFDIKNLFLFIPNMMARYLGKAKNQK